MYHSTLGSRVIKKKQKKSWRELTFDGRSVRKANLVHGFGFRVLGFEFRVWEFRFRVCQFKYTYLAEM